MTKKNRQQIDDLIDIRELRGMDKIFPKTIHSFSPSDVESGKALNKNNFSFILGGKKIRIY